MNLQDTIRTVPDFPKEGILFRDISTLLKDAEAFRCLIDTFAAELKDKNIDYVVGPEARGFAIGSAVEYACSWLMESERRLYHAARSSCSSPAGIFL